LNKNFTLKSTMSKVSDSVDPLARWGGVAPTLDVIVPYCKHGAARYARLIEYKGRRLKLYGHRSKVDDNEGWICDWICLLTHPPRYVGTRENVNTAIEDEGCEQRYQKYIQYKIKSLSRLKHLEYYTST
jgi:hypothetical protein